MSESKSSGKSRLIKIVVLGRYAVGKTSLLRCFADPTYSFQRQYKATIGLETVTKNIEIDNENVQLQIWDTAGQERFNSLSDMYFRGADAVILVYDMTDPASFEMLPRWKDEFYRSSGVDHCAPCAIIANKSDRINERKVSRKKALSWVNFVVASLAQEASQNQTLTPQQSIPGASTSTSPVPSLLQPQQLDVPTILYFETSAKDSTNVSQAINEVAKAALARQKAREGNDVADVSRGMGGPGNVVLEHDKNRRANGGGGTTGGLPGTRTQTQANSCC